MLRKYSIFMMLLLSTGSLVGISSIYQPTNVETQPQPLVKEPSTQIPGAGQFLADKILVDRIFPKIVAKLDGATILQKIDARTLAAKVLPYLDLKVSVIEKDGQTARVDGTGPDPPHKVIGGKAYCAPEETIVSGGFILYTGDGEIYASKKIHSPDGWSVGANTGRGDLLTFATCLRVELGLVAAEQAQQPQQQPSPPPGGPPLQPPPNLR